MDKQELTLQPRFEWYGVHKVALGLVEVANQTGLKPENLVFIGGMACFFHLESVFGKSETMSWRGTQDVDLVVFGMGNVLRFMKGIKTSTILKEAVHSSSHLPDKWSCRVKNPVGQDYLPEEKRWTDIDLYGQVRREGISLNQRTLRPEQIIYDPPICLETGGRRVVHVPSLRDTLTLKLDVLFYSPHLRPKDQFDVLGCLAKAETKGIALETITREAFAKIFTREQAIKTVGALRELKTVFQTTDLSGWRLPSREYLKNLEDYLPK